MAPTDPVRFGFKAIKPFDAEHPIGSGTMVHYAPGDEVPASEWGRAEGFMVEAGSIMRYAINVAEVPGQITAPPKLPPTDSPLSPPEQGPRPLSPENQETHYSEDLPDTVEEEWELPEDGSYPFHKGGPLWVLSDRSLFRGKKAQALAAEAGIAVAAEGGSE